VAQSLDRIMSDLGAGLYAWWLILRFTQLSWK